MRDLNTSIYIGVFRAIRLVDTSLYYTPGWQDLPGTEFAPYCIE